MGVLVLNLFVCLPIVATRRHHYVPEQDGDGNPNIDRISSELFTGVHVWSCRTSVSVNPRGGGDDCVAYHPLFWASKEKRKHNATILNKASSHLLASYPFHS